MANGIRTGDSRGFNKGRSSNSVKVPEFYKKPEEGRRTYRPKRPGNNKDEGNSPKTLNDKTHLGSSQKFIDKHLKKAGGHIDRLVCWVLWHINICRLFNAKSIFM